MYSVLVHIDKESKAKISIGISSGSGKICVFFRIRVLVTWSALGDVQQFHPADVVSSSIGQSGHDLY